MVSALLGWVLAYGAPPGASKDAPAKVIEKVEVVPGELTVTVYSHSFAACHGPVDAWTYVTSGLARHKQAELVFTVARTPHQDEKQFPRDVLAFFRTVQSLAVEGRLVGVNDHTWWRDQGLAGDADIRAVVYASARPIAGIDLPHDALALIPFREDELSVAERQGHTRILLRLAARYRCFPFPQWFEPDRPSVFPPEMIEGSLLAKWTKDRKPNQLPGFHVLLEGDRLVLRIPRWQLQFLRGLSATDHFGAVFLADFDPTADSCVAYEPTVKARTVLVGPDGSLTKRRCGAFLVLEGGRGVPNTMRIVEDGFTVSVHDNNWTKLLAALKGGRPVMIPAGGDRPAVVVEWTDEPAAEHGRDGRAAGHRRQGGRRVLRRMAHQVHRLHRRPCPGRAAARHEEVNERARSRVEAGRRHPRGLSGSREGLQADGDRHQEGDGEVRLQVVRRATPLRSLRP